MRVKVENRSPEEASVTVEVPEDGEARMMEALAVTSLVNAIDHEGYGPAVKALDESWHGFVTGVLGGFYAARRSEAELVPVFKVLMAMVGVAKDGFASVAEEEYRIVEEGKRCPSASASDAEGSSSPRPGPSIGAGVTRARASPGRGSTPGTTPRGTGPTGAWTPRSRSTAMWTTIRGPWTTTSRGSNGSGRRTDAARPPLPGQDSPRAGGGGTQDGLRPRQGPRTLYLPGHARDGPPGVRGPPRQERGLRRHRRREEMALGAGGGQMTVIVSMGGDREVRVEVGEAVMTCSLEALGELHVFMDRVRDVLCDAPYGSAVRLWASLPEGVEVKTLVQTQKEGRP